MSQYYKHEATFRNPVTIGALAVCLAFCAFAVYAGAPWYFLLITGLPTALLALNVILNPVSGVECNDRYIRAFSGRWEKRISVARVKGVKIMKFDTGADRIKVFLKNGRYEHIPASCLGKIERFEAALKNAGLKLLDA